MKLRTSLVVLTAGILALTLGIGLTVYHSASAANAAQTGMADQADLLNVGSGGFHAEGMTKEDLAAALGITTDELTAAVQQAKSDALAQAVTDGLITQAQADEISQRGAAFPLGGRWEGWLVKNGIDFKSFLANALGITPQELSDAILKARYTAIDRAVTDGRITSDQADLMKGRLALANDSTFTSSIQSAFEAAVNQAVSDGVITQAQADQILANQEARGNWGLGGLDDFGGGRGPRGHGGPGEGGWLNAAPSTTETP